MSEELLNPSVMAIYFHLRFFQKLVKLIENALRFFLRVSHKFLRTVRAG
jgi:hypothetical protein